MGLAVCIGCNSPLPPMKHQGNPRKWCSAACYSRTRRAEGRWARQQRITVKACASCAQPFRPSEAQSNKWCSDACRDASRIKTCEACSQRFVSTPGTEGRFCSPGCVATVKRKFAAERKREMTTPRLRRNARVVQAPGLSQYAMRRLLQRWRAQGRRCFYCAGNPTTVDHVIALVRGGTNFEGNLVPCCKRCNSSKGGLTVMEWKGRQRRSAATTAAIGA